MEYLNLIFLKNSMLLSNKKYNHWREIQDEFEDYKASVNFKSLEDVVEYISFDYKKTKSFTEELVEPIKYIKNSFITLEFE